MPEALGSYELLFHIASGGMAEVYAARKRGEAGFERLVAVKRMLPNLADNDEFMTMFLDEGRLAGHIQSAHVVQTTDLGRTDDGSPYIVMDLVVGLTLSEIVRSLAKKGELVPSAIVVELIAQASQGLHDAHEARTPGGEPLHLVHRDVSPQNILCGVDGRARITDFGVARAMLRYTRTTTGLLKGKFGYFSPEQARGEEIDRRSDIFALGVVTWEALTGRRLLRGDTPIESLHRLLALKEPPSTREWHPELPEEVDAVLARALAQRPHERPPTAAAFASELREAVRTLPAPSPTEVGDFVASIGGERLAKLQEKLRLASTDDGLRELEALDLRSIRPSAPNSLTPSDPNAIETRVSTPPARQHSDGPALSPLPSGGTAVDVAAMKRRRRWPLAGGLALAVGGIVAALAWPESTVPMPDPVDAAAGNEEPARETASADPPEASPVATREASEADAPAPVAAADEESGEAVPQRSTRRRRASARRAAAPSPAEASPAKETGAEPKEPIAVAVAPAAVAPAAAPEPADSPAATTPPAKAAPPATTRPPTKAPAEDPAPGEARGPGIADVNAFDQFLGGN